MLSLSACRRSQAESQTARVDRLFTSWNGRDTPGCAVGISHNGAIVYEHGYGMANLELSVPITPATVFHIASISKSFTAMSIMLAAEHGQLSLDDEVQKFVPEWVDRDEHVTYRSDEIGVTYTVDARDSAMVVKSTGRPDVTISAFSRDVFVGDGVGIVKFSRDDRGATTAFTVNRDNARGVRFDRVK